MAQPCDIPSAFIDVAKNLAYYRLGFAVRAGVLTAYIVSTVK